MTPWKRKKFRNLRFYTEKCWRLLLTLFCCLLASATCWGDIPEFTIQVWSVGEGLPDNSVTSIAQTPDGYLWVGTINGLARFDGVHFMTFDSENTPALQQSRVDKLFLDSQGTLWINTFDGSLVNLRNGVFSYDWPGNVTASKDVTLVNSSSNAIIFAQIGGDLILKKLGAPAGVGWEKLPRPAPHMRALNYGKGQCVIWEAGSGKHLWRFADGKFELIPAALTLLGQSIHCVVADQQGRLWIGTDKEIAVWDGTRFQNETPTNGESHVDVGLLLASKDGSLWSVANGHLRKSIGRRWVAEVKSLNYIFRGGIGRTMADNDQHGGLWLYDYGEGLSYVSSNGQVKQFGLQDGFPPGRVNCLFEDHEGDWWAGLESGGLVRLRERQFMVLPSTNPFFKPAAKSVCEDASSNMWVATLGGGLEEWRGNALRSLTLPSGQAKGFFFSIFPDANGRLWVSAGDEDLHVLDRGIFKQITPVIHGVKSILVDHSGRIWVGTTGGLFEGTSAAAGDFKLVAGTSGFQVRTLIGDHDGAVWFGCGDGSIFQIIGGKKIRAFHPPAEWGNRSVMALLAENDGTIWVGTYRGGLLRLKDGRFTRFTKVDGLPDDFISQILIDGMGYIWLGTHHGVFRVSKAGLERFAQGDIKTISGIAFGQSDGLPSFECSSGYQPACWRDHDGRLWFTTAKGATFIQPQDIGPNLPPPSVLIEEVVVDGQTVIPKLQVDNTTGKNNASPAFHAVQLMPIEIAPGKHRIEIRYTGLSLAAPDRVQFRCRLVGAEQDWIWVGSRRFADYNLLPPGNYQFQVVARNSDSIWSKDACVLTLRIRPHFYETLWFRIFTGIFGLGLIVGVLRHRFNLRLRRKLQKLERIQAVERERTRIAKDIHDDLGSSLTLIAVLGDIVSRDKADERLGKISATARQAVKSLDEIVWAVNPRNDTLGHLIDYAGQFTVDYLSAAGINCFLDVPEHVPPIELSSNVRHNIYLVIKESLQNVVKHAQATDVWLKVCLTPECVRVVIEDNGRGFAQVPDNALADGLRNMRQRMSEIGGNCCIESRMGGGTTVVIEFFRSPSSSVSSHIHTMAKDRIIRHNEE